MSKTPLEMACRLAGATIHEQEARLAERDSLIRELTETVLAQSKRITELSDRLVMALVEIERLRTALDEIDEDCAALIDAAQAAREAVKTCG